MSDKPVNPPVRKNLRIPIYNPLEWKWADDAQVFDPGDALLLENGDYLLLEGGDKVLLETGT